MHFSERSNISEPSAILVAIRGGLPLLSAVAHYFALLNEGARGIRPTQFFPRVDAADTLALLLHSIRHLYLTVSWRSALLVPQAFESD